MTLEDRKQKEIEHSRKRRNILKGFERHSDTSTKKSKENLDSLIIDEDQFKHNFSNMKFYSITKNSERYQHDWLKKHCKTGVKILDFGCGNGENGIFAAQCGAEVLGIDISPEGVDNANLNAKQAGVDDHCRFEVMDGENMVFKDNSFDLAVEYGALHHVDLDRAMTELNRVLKPDAEMICVEALRHNPLIHWYRKRTPHLRTEWEVEHILGVPEIMTGHQYFKQVSVKYFHLAALAGVPFRKRRFFSAVLLFLDSLDAVLLRIPYLQRLAWLAVIVYSRPVPFPK